MKKLSAILALVLVLLTFTACGAGYEKPMKNADKAIINADHEKYVKTFLDPFYAEYLMDKDDDLEDEDDIVKNYKDTVKEISKSMSKTYGDHIKVSYEIENVRKFTKEDIKFLGEYMDDKYDYEKGSVSNIVVVSGYKRTTGDDASEKDYFEEVMIKVKGKWYNSLIFSSLDSVKSAIIEGSGMND